MTDQAAQGDALEPTAAAEPPAEAPEDHIPDASTLMGKTGVEEEMLAELARAEAKMSDLSAPDDPQAEGAQI